MQGELFSAASAIASADPTGEVFDASYTIQGQVEMLALHADGRDQLLVKGAGTEHSFAGRRQGDFLLCPADHQNRLAINALLPYTNPTAIGRDMPSFGLGDRLGLANYAHLLSVKGRTLVPVLAQQSKRELNLTHRTYADVLDAAVWAVVKAGWRSGFGADGDHLKNVEDIQNALALGYSMITLDCSEKLHQPPTDSAARQAAYEQLPADVRHRYEKRYVGLTIPSLGLSFTDEVVKSIAIGYHDAIELAKTVYFTCIRSAGRPVDLELSLDETTFTTSPEAHYFVAQELEEAGVVINSMAPRFVGEFQKGIDYIGDLSAFAVHLQKHTAIADHFGYKISVHSGSDKFSVFSSVGEITGCRVHVKTAGTSWLEAVRVIAQQEPALYRELHRNALKHLDQARAYYVVHADVSRIRPLDNLQDAELPSYLDENDARQLLHITYGFQLEDPILHQKLFDALELHRKAYECCLQKHIARHLDGIGFQKDTNR
jgi:hypothetical protein